MNAVGIGKQAEAQVDDLMRLFYEVISFEDGGAPDWQSMEGLFSSHARITRITPEAIDYMDLTAFKNMAEEMIELGAFTSFHEREIGRRADRFGNVMHVASAYETKISPDAVDYIERGVNSLQLVSENGGWKIVSLCWDDHAPFSMAGLHKVGGGV
ncbi:MAG TPA: hypothetical protein VH062_01250 [Polyangiaceae bacterium]|jgi:hypothetical protein|nr:hypothetical protein [Polyangiaceae bacterium]